MKQILLATTAVLALAGTTYAQTSSGSSGSNAKADAVDHRSEGNRTAGGDSDFARTNNDGNNNRKGIANVEGDDDARALVQENNNSSEAQAFVRGNGHTAVARQVTGDDNSDTEPNDNVQFQMGVGNSTVNHQVGHANKSATLQAGLSGYDEDEVLNNSAVISQNGNNNKGAITQLGKENETVILQEANHNAAASTSVGVSNQSIIYQGDTSVASHTQIGDNNVAMTAQARASDAVHIQEGDYNSSFISQGINGPATNQSVNGESAAFSLPGGANVNTQGNIETYTNRNSAASVQISDSGLSSVTNSSAIVQYGQDNEAVNYQDSSS